MDTPAGGDGNLSPPAVRWCREKDRILSQENALSFISQSYRYGGRDGEKEKKSGLCLAFFAGVW